MLGAFGDNSGDDGDTAVSEERVELTRRLCLLQIAYRDDELPPRTVFSIPPPFQSLPCQSDHKRRERQQEYEPVQRVSPLVSTGRFAELYARGHECVVTTAGYAV